MESARPLRLLAQDIDDLGVISAALQDAVARIGDIRWEREGRRLTIALNRFRWEAADAPPGAQERVRAAVQFGGVMNVRARNLRPEARDAVVQLLAVTFEAGEAPGGEVTFAFADGADLVAEVECLDGRHGRSFGSVEHDKHAGTRLRPTPCAAFTPPPPISRPPSPPSWPSRGALPPMWRGR